MSEQVVETGSAQRVVWSRRSSIDKARLSANPTLPRLGRVARQAARCLTVHSSATMSELKQWCYAGRAHAHWQYEVIREALIRLGAVQIGRAGGIGRPAIWAYTENPSK
jgi:hypothetical protein